MNSRQENAVVLAAGAAALVGVGLLYTGFETQRHKRNQSVCISNYKQIGLASMQYIRDYDEMTPPGVNWSSVLAPYARSKALFQCPERGGLPQGVAFHSQAALVNISSWNSSQTTIWYFDSNGGGFNTSDAGTSFAQPYRHPAGNAICYADGHVKMMRMADFAAGYGGEFEKSKAESILSRARFWADYQARQKRELSAKRKKR